MNTSSSLIHSSKLVLGALLATASVGHAQSILRTAGDFVALGGTAITSTGVSGTVLSNGDVGLFPTATTGITGFPPAVVVNGSIIGTGPVTGQAMLDLIDVSTALALMPSDMNLSNADLGGMILGPGVYTFNSAATLNGELFLDGQGKDDAFWVFQIGDTLITSLNSRVTLINTGTALGADYGLFWNAATAITLGENNVVAGNYLAGTSITVGALAAGGARMLAQAAVTFDNNQIDVLGGPAASDWTGGLAYNLDGAIVPAAAIPEPSSTAALAGLAILGCAALRRRRRA